MIDIPAGDGSAIYPRLEYIGFGDWRNTKALRIQRLATLVKPTLIREATRLDNHPRINGFFRAALEELTSISQQTFVGGDYPSEIPIFSLLSSYGVPSFKVNGSWVEHDQETMVAAQCLIDALCPELGIRLDDQAADLLQKARRAKVLGFAEIYSTDSFEFSTVLPAVALSLDLSDGKTDASLSWKVM